MADRFEDHNEVTDGLTCILCCGVGGSFLAVSYLAGVKEDPLLSHLYSNYTMKYRDSRNVVSRRFTVQLFQVAHDFRVVIKKKAQGKTLGNTTQYVVRCNFLANGLLADDNASQILKGL